MSRGSPGVAYKHGVVDKAEAERGLAMTVIMRALPFFRQPTRRYGPGVRRKDNNAWRHDLPCSAGRRRWAV